MYGRSSSKHWPLCGVDHLLTRVSCVDPSLILAYLWIEFHSQKPPTFLWIYTLDFFFTTCCCWNLLCLQTLQILCAIGHHIRQHIWAGARLRRVLHQRLPVRLQSRRPDLVAEDWQLVLAFVLQTRRRRNRCRQKREKLRKKPGRKNQRGGICFKRTPTPPDGPALGTLPFTMCYLSSKNGVHKRKFKTRSRQTSGTNFYNRQGKHLVYWTWANESLETNGYGTEKNH